MIKFKSDSEIRKDINKILQLLEKDIIEDEDFNEASRLFFQDNLSFNELQMNLFNQDRKIGLEKLMIFADHLVLNKITSIETINNRVYLD